MKFVKHWWKNLLIANKLYILFGVSAVLIGLELLTLVFAMNTLSSFRALVAGEGRWSKAQKNAIIQLQEYVNNKDEKHYKYFLSDLKIPLSNYYARIELEKLTVNYDVVRGHLLDGGIHELDVNSLIVLLKYFNKQPFLNDAINEWKVADALLAKIVQYAKELKIEINKSPLDSDKIKYLMTKVSNLNQRLTEVENSFSHMLGAASRWLEDTIIYLMLFTILSIEGVIFYLVFKFCNKFTHEIQELNQATIKVGEGDFSTRIKIDSNDEIGQMSKALNKMIENLRTQTSEKEIAEHANQTKNLFLANISHEIRTPLNSILGFTEILRNSELSTSERNYYLDIVKRTGLTLTTIISDILDLSKIEADHLTIEKSEFSLGQLLEDLFLSLNLKCEEKGIILKFIKIGDVAEYIHSDPIRIRQVLTNLIGNSIKFTDSGFISVRYEVKDNMLFFEIEDTGVGISSEQQKLLFTPFSQGDSSIKKKFGGTGLGLVISKKLAHLLGGDVKIINSIEGRGSIFQFCIEYIGVFNHLNENEGLTTKAQLDLRDCANRNILVVEDTIDNQILIKMFLIKRGFKLTFVNNGEEALELLKSQPDFDVILMDMQMPIMDGYTATEHLRKRGFKKPIVAMTGYSMKGDKKKCLDSGCDLYISKPFSNDELIDIIIKAMNTESPMPHQ